MTAFQVCRLCRSNLWSLVIERFCLVWMVYTQQLKCTAQWFRFTIELYSDAVCRSYEFNGVTTLIGMYVSVLARPLPEELHINSHKLMESSQGSWCIYSSLVVKGPFGLQMCPLWSGVEAKCATPWPQRACYPSILIMHCTSASRKSPLPALCPWLLVATTFYKLSKFQQLRHLVIGGYSRFLFKQNGTRQTIAWI